MHKVRAKENQRENYVRRAKKQRKFLHFSAAGSTVGAGTKKLSHFCRFNFGRKRKKWIPTIVCWCITQQYYRFSTSELHRCDFEKRNIAKNKINIDNSIEREWKNWHAKGEKIEEKKSVRVSIVSSDKKKKKKEKQQQYIIQKERHRERVRTWSDYVNNISHSSRRRTHTNRPNRKRGDLVFESRACDFRDWN